MFRMPAILTERFGSHPLFAKEENVLKDRQLDDRRWSADAAGCPVLRARRPALRTRSWVISGWGGGLFPRRFDHRRWNLPESRASAVQGCGRAPRSQETRAWRM